MLGGTHEAPSSVRLDPQHGTSTALPAQSEAELGNLQRGERRGLLVRANTGQTPPRWLDRDGERVMTEVVAGERNQLNLLLQAAA